MNKLNYFHKRIKNQIKIRANFQMIQIASKTILAIFLTDLKDLLNLQDKMNDFRYLIKDHR